MIAQTKVCVWTKREARVPRVERAIEPAGLRAMFRPQQRTTSKNDESPTERSEHAPERSRARSSCPLHGVVQGSHLGLEIDVSTFRSVLYYQILFEIQTLKGVF